MPVWSNVRECRPVLWNDVSGTSKVELYRK